MKLVNRAEHQKAHCRICEKIEIKNRRRRAEYERLSRWEREGGTLVASMERSRKLLLEIDRDIQWLKQEREERKRML